MGQPKSEKMVCSVTANSLDARHLVEGLRNSVHCSDAERVREPGGLSAKASQWDWSQNYRTCVQTLVMLLSLAK